MEILTGKVAVVTGAAKGFGFSLARAFAEERMHVVLADVDETGLKRAAAEMEASGAEVIGVVTDVSDASAVERLRDVAFERFGTVHVLCNNAGIGGGGSVCEPVNVTHWHSVFSVNFFGALHGVNAFLPRMLEQGDGHIVNTASRGGLLPLPNLGAYVPAKFGLVAYSEMLHAELALREAPVSVTVLTPSGLRTPLLLDPLASLEPGSNPALEAYYVALVEAAVEPDDFAHLAVRAIKANALYANSHRATLDAARARLDRMFADTELIGTIK